MLVYGAIPAGFVALVALLVFLPSIARASRYRPGRPWNYDPVWYVPHPRPGESPMGAGRRPADGSARPTAPGPDGTPASVLSEVPSARGGAHGSW